MRERERERERDTHTHTHTQTVKQTDTQTSRRCAETTIWPFLYSGRNIKISNAATQ